MNNKKRMEALEDYLWDNQLKGEVFTLSGEFVVWSIPQSTLYSGRDYNVRIYKTISKNEYIHVYVVDITDPSKKYRYRYAKEDLKSFVY